MAVNAVQLVTDQLSPVLALDADLPAKIGRQVEAQIVLQGWSAVGLDDQKTVYVSVLATQALLTPLILLFSQRQKLKRAKGGTSEAEYQEAIDFLKALQEQLKAQVKLAAKEAAPEDAEVLRPPGYPKPDVRRL